MLKKIHSSFINLQYIQVPVCIKIWQPKKNKKQKIKETLVYFFDAKKKFPINLHLNPDSSKEFGNLKKMIKETLVLSTFL